jgi:sec-independent protein translocase protein TatA
LGKLTQNLEGAFMGRFSYWEIAIIVILIFLIFGGRRLPELGRALGKGISNFKSSLSDKNTKDNLSGDQNNDKNPSDSSQKAKKEEEKPL